eukprot:TRINITY_DN12066_c0_g1_i1.p1 TRINITY_DN12066_c0_g1~~TRINITY_DN12066_c0_g1_i1.p1  ORF type:complete len:207 (-),score=45.98 TRINITY_DN12066_c0_g1_i1:30-650(-)
MHRAIPSASKILSKKWEQDRYEAHRKKLRDIRPMVDNKAPKRQTHLESKLKKLQLEEERLATIERDNRILLEKMSNIMQTGKGPTAAAPAPKVQSLNQVHRRQEVDRITKENQAILKRIQEKEPHYSHLQWEEDRKKNEVYLNNIMEYKKEPSPTKTRTRRARPTENNGTGDSAAENEQSEDSPVEPEPEPSPVSSEPLKEGETDY